MYSRISGYEPQKYKIPRIQPTDHKKCNKQKCPSEEVSIPVGREKAEGGKEGPWEVGGEGAQNQIYWVFYIRHL